MAENKILVQIIDHKNGNSVLGQDYFESREKAKRAIMAGIVRDDYDYIDKPGTKIPVDSYSSNRALPFRHE